MSGIINSVKHWLAQYPVLYDNLKYLGVLLLAYAAYIITKKVFFRLIHKFTEKTKTQLDNLLFNDKVVHYLSYIPPLYVLHRFAYLVEGVDYYIELTASAFIILNVLLALGNFITSITEYYSKKEQFAGQPIKGYGQIAKIILYIFGALFIAGLFTGEKPWVILTGLGALSAIILLIFKDTILSLVASIQISSNELFKIGDWIEVPSFGADGEVIDITLHSVKIQNWDKTYTLIPTYKLVENSIKNWKGMEKAGKRRIKRSVSIDTHTVKFADSAAFKRIADSPYFNNMIKKQLKTENFSEEQSITNLGLFIRYMQLYLAQRDDVSKEPGAIVRTLQPTHEGLPVEIYAFCNSTNFEYYENTQKEIFEHIFAVIHIFGLSINQSISSNDLAGAVSSVKKA